MGFFCTIADCYKKMFVPNGRASRREFWYFQLYMFLIYIAVVSLFAQVLTWTYGRSSVTALGTAPGFLIMLLILLLAGKIAKGGGRDSACAATSCASDCINESAAPERSFAN